MTYFNTTIMFDWIVDLTFWFPTKSPITKTLKYLVEISRLHVYLENLFRYPLSNLTFCLCPHKSIGTTINICVLKTNHKLNTYTKNISLNISIYVWTRVSKMCISWLALAIQQHSLLTTANKNIRSLVYKRFWHSPHCLGSIAQSGYWGSVHYMSTGVSIFTHNWPSLKVRVIGSLVSILHNLFHHCHTGEMAQLAKQWTNV